MEQTNDSDPSYDPVQESTEFERNVMTLRKYRLKGLKSDELASPEVFNDSTHPHLQTPVVRTVNLDTILIKKKPSEQLLPTKEAPTKSIPPRPQSSAGGKVIKPVELIF